MRSADLKSVATHFRFGENWTSFARLLVPERIGRAEACLRELISEDISGKSFLDIGSGSGLSALSAARMGVAHLVACDIDPDSVRTTKAVLEQHSPSKDFEVRQLSVFGLTPEAIGRFDVVYSWGVLHHTGSMWEAIDKAAALVTPGGLLVLALYLRTPFCPAWRIEKRLYVSSPKVIQDLLFHLYKGTAMFYMRLRGIDPKVTWNDYQTVRGMDQDHDIRDWLGGYPYESASPEEVEAFLAPKGFTMLRSFRTKSRTGLMGTGCAEYVYRKSEVGS